MPLWIVRAGSRGEQEQRALQNGFCTIGWNDMPDLSKYATREQMIEIYQEIYPNAKQKRAINQASQLFSFVHRINVGDYVLIPLKSQSAIAIGKITGKYEYRTDLDPDVKHYRTVKWIKTDIPRAEFDQDLLYSFGAFMTVCQIRRNNAEERILAILDGKRKPAVRKENIEEIEEEEQVNTDLEKFAKDQIVQLIKEKYANDRYLFTELVDQVLRAQGYHTQVSAPGPDGGVDILAGSGPLGFQSPRIAVQVNATSAPVDVTVLRNLQGVLKKFGADQGLLVSWSGFNRAALEEGRRSFFEIRFWDSMNLIDEFLKVYEKLPDDIQAEIPLKRIWTIVPDLDE